MPSTPNPTPLHPAGAGVPTLKDQPHQCAMRADSGAGGCRKCRLSGYDDEPAFFSEQGVRDRARLEGHAA